MKEKAIESAIQTTLLWIKSLGDVVSKLTKIKMVYFLIFLHVA